MKTMEAFFMKTVMCLLIMLTFSAHGKEQDTFSYFFVNASQLAVLNMHSGRMSLGEEGMSIEACSELNGMPCFSIPYLGITIAFPVANEMPNDWIVEGRLYCVKQTITDSTRKSVYFVEVGPSSSNCNKLVADSSFLLSKDRGLIQFTKTGNSSRKVFVLVDSMGYGAY